MTRPLALIALLLATQHAAAQSATPKTKENPFLSGDQSTGPVINWFSLGPQRNDLAGGAYDRDQVTDSLRANESITVFARRHKDIPEDYTTGRTPGEAWNSDAAQSAFPALGAGCNKYTVCVSPDQKSLRSSIFGD